MALRRKFFGFIGVAMSVSLTWAESVSGSLYEVEGGMVAGARIRLLGRGDSTLSRADGTFTVKMTSLAIQAGYRRAPVSEWLEEKRLRINTPKGGTVSVEAFSLDDRRMLESLHVEVESGNSSLDLPDWLRGLRGLAWLRVTAGTQPILVRLLGTGHPSEASPIVAKASAQGNILDTLVVEKEGYYRERQYIYAPLDPTWFPIPMRKNSIHGMAPEEVQA